jgi:hypothetical protein
VFKVASDDSLQNCLRTYIVCSDVEFSNPLLQGVKMAFLPGRFVCQKEQGEEQNERGVHQGKLDEKDGKNITKIEKSPVAGRLVPVLTRHFELPFNPVISNEMPKAFPVRNPLTMKCTRMESQISAMQTETPGRDALF